MTSTEAGIEVGRYALRTFRTLSGPDDGAWRLDSVSMSGGNWGSGTCEAICKTHNDAHAAPSEGCNCGIYGTLTLEHLMTQYSNFAREMVAVIAAEGKTIIGDKGLRTAYARVVAYWYSGTAESRVKAIAATQFENAEAYEDRDKMLEAFGFPSYTFIEGVPLQLDATMDVAVPDRSKSFTYTATVHNVLPGIYMQVQMGDETLLEIPALTITAPCSVVLTFDWVPPVNVGGGAPSGRGVV